MTSNRPTHAHQPGRFIVLIGPDGTGKTTLAAEIIRIHGDLTQYVHFRPSVTSPPNPRPAIGSTPPPKRTATGPTPVGWLRIAWSLVVFWIGYLRWIRPAKKRGSLVVGDRWIYGYFGQPIALGFAGPSWLARLVCWAAPRPDLVVRLTAPAEVIATRKIDLSVEEIKSEERVWTALKQVGLTVDTRDDVTKVAENILSVVGLANATRR